MESQKQFEIYFCDLKEEAQKELLKMAGIEEPKEMNWDTLPIATISLIEE